MKPWLRYLLLTFWLGATVYFNTVAAELYRYKNEDSVTVLDSYVPARYVKNGYAILSMGGRVLKSYHGRYWTERSGNVIAPWRQKKALPEQSESVKSQTRT